jgi:aspartate/methionine/tyrosine aminotransferase
MKYVRMPIEIESPEMMGYQNLNNNLTESSVFDAMLGDIKIDVGNLTLCYGHHIGHPELRKLIAKEASPSLNEDQVLLTAGAATALFIVNTSLLNSGDEIVVMHPNYGTNIETPRAMGCEVKLWSLEIAEGFRPNIERLKSLVSKKTKLISITTPHNPTGMCIHDDELNQIINIADENDAYLLIDETYRDIPLRAKKELAAIKSHRIISVSSLSKAYGLPGIRIGWIVTQNRDLLEQFLAAKEQIQICNSVVDEEIAYQFLLKNTEYIELVKERLQENYTYFKAWISSNSEHFEFVLPEGGCVCFPKLKKQHDPKKFYKKLNEIHGTFVGNGHWFEMDISYMRIGFGWPNHKELITGLTAIDACLK